MEIQNLIDKIRHDKKLMIVFLLGFVGVLMLIFMNIYPDDKKTESTTEMQTKSMVYSTYDIEKMLEKKLIDIISEVNGAGETNCVVSVSSSGEYVYAENIKKENDSNSVSEDSEIVVYESQNGADAGLVVSIRSPDIIGVAIICEGGESSVVKAEITKLVTSLFGIGSDRVYVGNKAVN
ncbi:MAG: hypothetical protein J6Q94_09825 [Clostridia bacterium]|nr:hypothetical protein [Clostridia bacterium]